MLDDSLTDLEGKIQPGESQIALLELFNDVKRMQIVIEPVAVRSHEFVKLAFAGVPERWMPDVMHQSQRLGQIGIQSEGPGDNSRDLGHFEGMRKTIAKMIGIARGEDLRFCFQTPECPRVDDTVAIPRVNIPVGVRRLGITPTG